MTSLVAETPIGYPVGKLVEQWVREALINWQMNVPDRYRSFDGYLRLLAWDLAGSALAYVDWDVLLRLLSGETITDDNLFTWSLYRSIMNDSYLKDWFEGQLNAWVDAPAVRLQHNATISVVVYNLLQSTYTVINWGHVARAFQPGY